MTHRKMHLMTVALLLNGSVVLAGELPALKLEPQITVSGISSGAYMASQYHLAHADTVSGVALIAGGPYGCANNSLRTALGSCVEKAEGMAPVAELVGRARERMKAGSLAPESAVTGDKVWLFHGSKDLRVGKSVTDASLAFYRELVGATNTQYVENVPVAHGFPTKTVGIACDAQESPYLNACQYDAAGEMLTYLLGSLQPAASTAAGKVLRFNQSAYAPNGESTLAEQGYLYLPQACANGERCRLHVAFHGCQQNSESIGEQFVNGAGYNNWADSNRIVVLYPQTRSSMLPLNPKACWDWWGYTDEHYDTKKGNQVASVHAMVKALQAGN